MKVRRNFLCKGGRVPMIPRRDNETKRMFGLVDA